MNESWGEAALAGLFGLLIGSFLNACIYRLPRHLSVVTPRSFCPECEASIAWYDNIPLLSYCLLRARCRSCKASIGPRYPLTELVTALVFFAVAYRWGVGIEGLKWAVFGSLMIVLFWTDLETRLLPDVLTIGGTVAAFLFALKVPISSVWLAPFVSGLPDPFRPLAISIASALLLAVPFLVFAEVYARLRHIAPIGFGDIKLLAMLASFLGMELGLLAMMIGSAAGAIIGLGYIWGTGKDPKTEAVPYGSFLCGAGLVVQFLGAELFTRWWRAGM